MNSIDLVARLRGFDLAAHAEWSAPDAALFGASGSGKSTVLEAIAGLRHDVRGPIHLLGRRIDDLPARARGIGWVPQDAALLPHLTVRGNLDFAVRARGDQQAASRAIDALEIGGLLERRAATLSGGERQRVAIARALSSAPRFLLLDEPLAAIDRPLRVRILPFLERLRRDLAIPYLLVTHDPLEVIALASEVLVIEQGRIAAHGPARDVFTSAAAFGSLHAQTAENRFDVRLLERGGDVATMRTTAGLDLRIALTAGFAIPARVAIHAEDVLLSTLAPHGLSAQNVLPGRITAIDPPPPAASGAHLVTADIAGERMVARVTQAAVGQLGLTPGQPVWLIFKAHAVHPIA